MDNNQQPGMGRRKMLEATVLASTALAIGLLGMEQTARADSGNNPNGIPYKDWQALKTKYFGADAIIPLPKPTISATKVANYANDLNDLRTKLITHLQTNLNLKRDAGDAGYSSIFVNRIDYQLAPVTEDSLSQVSTTFLATQAEILLDQAISLMQRALSDRSQWDDLAMKNFVQSIGFNQYADLDDIHNKETEHKFDGANNGFYDQPVLEIQRQLDVEYINNNVLTVANTFYADFFTQKWSDATINSIVASYQSAMLAENKSNPTLAASAQDIANNLTLVFQHGTANQYAANYLQNNSFSKSLEISNRRIEALKAAIDWQEANRGFQFKRTDVSRKYQYAMARSSADEHGIMNYQKRLQPLSTRFKKDFLDAIARLKVCAMGMSSIYGFNLPFPNLNDSGNLFDNCVSWSRSAANFYNRFIRLEQTYTLTVSVRSLIKKLAVEFAFGDAGEMPGDQYIDMLKKGNISFDIDESLFPNQKHVRIRGVNVFVSLNAYKKKQANLELVNGCISADLIPPPNSFYKHVGQTTDGIAYDNALAAPIPVNYGALYFKIPTVHIGRIGTRDFIRPAETAGTTVLYNVSPFGSWTVQLPQISKGNLYQLVYIDDIYLDFTVAVRNDA